MKRYTLLLIILLLCAAPALAQSRPKQPKPRPKPAQPAQPPPGEELDEDSEEEAKVKVPDEIIRQLTEAAGRDCTQYKSKSRNWAAKFARSVSAEPADLNQDGEPELVVLLANPCYCGVSGGNCSTRVYHKTERGYELLLDAGSVQKLKPRETATGGYSDLVTEAHSSATDTFVSVYQWDGKQYRLKECLIRRFTGNQQGRAVYQEIPQTCPPSK